ncbi:MAG TPA: serine/threonine-protein kinase [Gemmataceae bacterium]|nr:serine/threonine-protein kinase [Gemmataceae bacterium]
MPQTSCCSTCGTASADVGADGLCPQCRGVKDPGELANTLLFDANAATVLPGGPSGVAAAPGAAAPEEFGRYRLLKSLGEGAMGAVYLAHDTQLDRQVALKVPQFRAEEGSTARERFSREARAAAGLIHANICPVYDVGECNGVPYLTMGYIEGRPLAELLKSGKTFTQRQSAMLVRKIALALEEAHRRGVVHRDLKPSNIMINQRGEPVVMDFGLAQRLVPGDVRLTQSGLVIGTPAYMAPEQANGDLKAMGPCSDIYSLGAILYELMTGQTPFTGSMMGILVQLVTEEPAPPSQRRPGLDARLEAICLKALAKEPGQRYASMSAFAEALTDFLRSGSALNEPAAAGNPAPTGAAIQNSGSRARATVRAPDTMPTIPAEAASSGEVQPMNKPPQRQGRWWLWTAVGVAGLLAVGIPLLVLKPWDRSAKADSSLVSGKDSEAEAGKAGKAAAEKPDPSKSAEQKSKTNEPGMLDGAARRGKRFGKRPETPVGEIRAFRSHDLPVTALAVSRDGQFALSGSSDKTLKLWEINSGRLVQTFPGHTDRVLSVALSPDGRQALSGSADRTVRLWDLSTGKARSFEGHAAAVTSVAFSPDGRQALSGSNDRTLRLWDTTTGKQAGLGMIHPDRVTSVAFSADSRMAATGCWDGSVNLWDLGKGRRLSSFRGHTGPVLSVAIAPDDRQVLSGSLDKSLRLWDIAGGKDLHLFPVQRSGIRCVAFSADGQRILSGGGALQKGPASVMAGEDYTVRLWDRKSGKEVIHFDQHQAVINGVTFTPDSQHALSCSADHTLRLWQLPR